MRIKHEPGAEVLVIRAEQPDVAFVRLDLMCFEGVLKRELHFEAALLLRKCSTLFARLLGVASRRAPIDACLDDAPRIQRPFLDESPDVQHGAAELAALLHLRAPRIDHADKRNRLAHRAQQLRHLIRNHTTTAVATEVVRPVWLHFAKFSQVGLGHLLDGCVRLYLAVHATRLQAVERLVLAEVVRQIAEAKHVAAGTVHQEQLGARALGLDRHHVLPLARRDRAHRLVARFGKSKFFAQHGR